MPDRSLGGDYRVDPGDVRSRAEPLEVLAGRFERQSRAVLVAQRPAGEPDQRPCSRRLVGSPEILPCTPGATRFRKGLDGIAFGESHHSRRVRGHRHQGLASAPLGDFPELE